MTRLILIRHGETNYSSQRRYCGFSDLPLNAKGRFQVKRIAFRLKEISIDRVFSSDLKRAHKTAEIIFKNALIKKCTAFREMNFGIFEGLRHEETIEIYPKLYDEWIENPLKVKIPGGESLSELSKRVKEEMAFILSQYKGKTIAIVTHGGPIRIILCQALGYGLENFWKITQDIGALNIIDYPDGLPPVVVKMNDTTHLSEEERVSL